MNTIINFLHTPSNWLWVIYLVVFAFAVYHAWRIHYIMGPTWRPVDEK